MALVQFKDEINNVCITRKMAAPKKVERVEYWFKAARKVIPEIPGTYQSRTTQVTGKWITWELESPRGERCYVVIDRSIPAIGAN